MKNYRTNDGMLIDANTLNAYEIENGRLSYKTAWERITGNAPLVLCNNITQIDEYIYDNVVIGSLYDEDTDNYAEIYQYYITSLTDWDIEFLQKYASNDFIIAYSEVLENYILCVDHFGTSWDYVLTDIEIA